MKKSFIIASILLVAVSMSAKQYPDSVRQASAEEPNIAYGWNFEFAGGLGVSSSTFKQLGSSHKMNYTTNKINFPSVNAAIGIGYYFVPWMGIGTGVQFSTYANRSAFNKPWTETTYDKYGPQPWNQYTITSTPTGLHEDQMIYMIEVPLALKFRARPNKLGFTGTVGAKLGIPVYNRSKLASGGVFENQVYYEYFDLLMEDVPNVIEDVNISGASGSARLNTINWAAYMELGMLIRLHQRVDLAISVYGNYYFTDLLKQHSSTALGFYDGTTAGEYPMPYTTAYNGVLKTREVESLHPWNVGLKVGIQINANRTKAQRDYDREQRRLRKQQPVEEIIEEEPIIVEEVAIIEPVEEIVVDTTPVFVEPDPREEAIRRIRLIADSFDIDICAEFCAPEPTPVIKEDTVAKQLDDLLMKAVIFFDLDKAIPILEPEDILIRIADILTRHPEQKIHVNGHACKLGKPDYNKRLAMRRAKAVAAQLKELGVRDDQMIIASLGDDIPYRYNGQHQLSKDRRVEIVPTYRTTEIVRPGSRLAQIARRHYGNPEYWVFIYEANRDVIKDPSNLPVGVEVEIPNLSERLKGMTETQAMEEAERLKEEILKK
jgi:outer membrane protein OmpA-like peptidoglycan-associated protein